MISDELESTSGKLEAHLNDALSRVRNMRRNGRHPRYITYAKMITAATKCNRVDLAYEILSMARRDVPLLPERVEEVRLGDAQREHVAYHADDLSGFFEEGSELGVVRRNCRPGEV